MLIQLISYIRPILFGCCIGLVYGLLFIYQKGAFFSNRTSNAMQLWAHQLFSTMARFIGVAFLVWYLLPLPKIHLILVMMSFLIFFWVIVSQYKG
jgi:hypothetical protein